LWGRAGRGRFLYVDLNVAKVYVAVKEPDNEPFDVSPSKNGAGAVFLLAKALRDSVFAKVKPGAFSLPLYRGEKTHGASASLS
jgi:hypothetical protein